MTGDIIIVRDRDHPLKPEVCNTGGGTRGDIREDPRLRDRLMPFADRMDAGRKLSMYLSGLAPANACICTIPAGGVPVGVEIALALRLRILLAVVRKIKIPWNPEARFRCGDLGRRSAPERTPPHLIEPLKG